MNNKPTDKVSIQDIASRYPSDKAKKAIEEALKESIKDQEAMSAKAQAMRSDPTLLDSETERILIDFAAMYNNFAHMAHQENGVVYEPLVTAQQAIKDLIATTVNEVIGQNEEVPLDYVETIGDVTLFRNELRAVQRAKLQELINGR